MVFALDYSHHANQVSLSQEPSAWATKHLGIFGLFGFGVDMLWVLYCLVFGPEANKRPPPWEDFGWFLFACSTPLGLKMVFAI
jgi:hypothetical protein